MKPWADVTKHVQSAVVRVTHPVMPDNFGGPQTIFAWPTSPMAVCSGFFIHEDYILTAAHCLGAEMAVDGRLAIGVVWVDQATDLAVVQVDFTRPALKPSTGVARGDAIAAVGYAYGKVDTMVRIGHVSNANTVIPGLEGLWLVSDASFIGGMSGGPVVDEAGRVVSICQMSDGRVGIGRPLAVLLASVRLYWV